MRWAVLRLFSKFKPHTETSLEHPPKLLGAQAEREGTPSPPASLVTSLPTIDFSMFIPSYCRLFTSYSFPWSGCSPLKHCWPVRTQDDEVSRTLQGLSDRTTTSDNLTAAPVMPATLFSQGRPHVISSYSPVTFMITPSPFSW